MLHLIFKFAFSVKLHIQIMSKNATFDNLLVAVFGVFS